jgi:hypothetical protein
MRRIRGSSSSALPTVPRDQFNLDSLSRSAAPTSLNLKEPNAGEKYRVRRTSEAGHCINCRAPRGTVARARVCVGVGSEHVPEDVLRVHATQVQSVPLADATEPVYSR